MCEEGHDPQERLCAARRGIDSMEPDARELMMHMSELSEEAYCAGWMDGLEYALWNAVLNGSRKYGQLDIADAHISKLRELSDRCGGWIVFDDETEETFMPLELWQKKYEQYSLYLAPQR